jgi:DNA repair exonuclease SbcCD ATPase subunit
VKELSLVESKLNTILAFRATYQRAINSTSDLIAGINEKMFKLRQAVELCQLCLAEQANLKSYIEEQVSALLRNTLNQNIRYVLEPVFKDDGVSLKGFRQRVEENGVLGELNEEGDGAQNIVSFALRLIWLLLTKGLNKVLWLDEPLTNLRSGSWGPLIDFIIDLQQYFKNLQVVIITHMDANFPQTFHVVKKGWVSRVYVI